MPRSAFTPKFTGPLSWYVLLALAGALALTVELFGVHRLQTTEMRLADNYALRHAADYLPDPQIVIVDIDDASLAGMQEIAGLWPWPREIHADLVAALQEFRPRAIVFDMAFSERDPNRPKSDARLGEEIAAAKNTWLGAALLPRDLRSAPTRLASVAPAFGMPQEGRADAQAFLQLPLALAPEAWRLGLINSVQDSDGVLRRYYHFAYVDGWRIPSLPARVAAGLGAVLPQEADFLIRWPQERGHQRFKYADVYRMLTEERPGMAPEVLAVLQQKFGNKIIVIGSSATSSFDYHVTPVSRTHPGVDVLAVALDNLKNGRTGRIAAPAWPFAAGVLLLSLLAFAFTRRLHPLLTGAGLTLVSGLALFAADAWLAGGLLVPLATPLLFAWVMYLASALTGYIRERRAREQAVGLFGRFLNPTVVKQIVEQGETVESLSGRTKEITVLFSDIRGFTTLSETRSPQQVVDLLNRHFEGQTEVVFRHGGTLDKFIGDCIMAFWGAPLDEPQHARRALLAALEMQDALLAFKQELIDEGSDVGDFDVGIGLHTGPAVVGFIGARRKLDYTAIGDTVNLSSRVEGLTRGVARVLVTRETMQACGAMEGMSFIPHGAFAVKGRTSDVELFEPRRTHET